MKKSSILFLWVGLSVLLLGCSEKQKEEIPNLRKGVSQELAEYRKTVISNLKYQLHFEIPADKRKPITGNLVARFDYAKSKSSQSLLMDFKGDSSKIRTIIINGKEVDLNFEKEHVILSEDLLKAGKNQVEYEFTAGNEALNRREEYMYTLFVPDRARSAFPNFEQPNLKAQFKLSLTLPQDWEAIANGKAVDTLVQGEMRTFRFAETRKLPTYLFSFAAGKFKIATRSWRDKEIQLFYRETDEERIKASLDPIFESYKKDIEFYEKWTKLSYPFEEYGMVAIPDFQFGGMEHPGAILFKESTLFLPKEATQNQRDARAQLIAHEVAHQWFGDMVTMNWFDDVWTKEVYANFMAAKATMDSTDLTASNLKFIVEHFPGAYAVDRTSGANPIYSKLKNLQNANSMYGAIIYQKAPIMMRQLETLMGVQNFQKGIQRYLKTYAFDNATWEDLIQILNEETPEDLITWNKVWVNTPGRPIFKDSIRYEKDKIEEFSLRQVDPAGKNRVWPQSFDIILQNGSTDKNLTVKDTMSIQTLEKATGSDRPDAIWFNASGMGYGVMPIDEQALSKIVEIDNPITRAAQYIALYENMLEKRYCTPQELLQVYVSALNAEEEERNLSLLGRYINTIYWVFLEEEKRHDKTNEVEDQVWEALENKNTSNVRKELFKIYENIFESEKARDRLYAIWKDKNPPPKVHLKEEDYTRLAYALSLRKSYDGLLDKQFERLSNADRKKRFKVIRPALSRDRSARDKFFSSLEDTENRADESAILEALSLFHHPLLQEDSHEYLRKSLEWLPEIQRTGSLFFPERWVQANFSQYRSAEAYQIVQQFLKAHPDFNPKLREKIVQATDNLKRAREL